MIKEYASVISKGTRIAIESLKSPIRMYLNPTNLEKICDKELSPEQKKEKRKDIFPQKNEKRCSKFHITYL